jgi:hypothetical protein
MKLDRNFEFARGGKLHGLGGGTGTTGGGSGGPQRLVDLPDVVGHGCSEHL